jgi:hypothetical protein
VGDRDFVSGFGVGGMEVWRVGICILFRMVGQEMDRLGLGYDGSGLP